MMNPDIKQARLRRAQQAEDLKNNPVLSEAFTAIKAGYFEKFIGIKKGFRFWRYIRELRNVHESMQNLIRLESYINKVINEGKVIKDIDKGRGVE